MARSKKHRLPLPEDDFDPREFIKESEELEEDFLTERLDVPELIEAGIATDEEIQEHIQKDFDFLNEYFSGDNDG
jgi:hypothetical protein